MYLHRSGLSEILHLTGTSATEPSLLFWQYLISFNTDPYAVSVEAALDLHIIFTQLRCHILSWENSQWEVSSENSVFKNKNYLLHDSISI